MVEMRLQEGKSLKDLQRSRRRFWTGSMLRSEGQAVLDYQERLTR